MSINKKSKNGTLTFTKEDINRQFVEMSQNINGMNEYKPPFLTDIETLKMLRNFVLTFDRTMTKRDFENLTMIFVVSNSNHTANSSDPTENALSNIILNVAKIRSENTVKNREQLDRVLIMKTGVKLDEEYQNVLYDLRPLTPDEIKTYSAMISEHASTLGFKRMLSDLKISVADYESSGDMTDAKSEYLKRIRNLCMSIDTLCRNCEVHREDEPVFFLNNKEKREESLSNTVDKILYPGAVLSTPNAEFNAIISGHDCSKDGQYSSSRVGNAMSCGFELGKLYLIGAPTGGGKSLTMLQICEWIRQFNNDIAANIYRETGKRPIIVYITQENTVTETIGRFGKMFFQPTGQQTSFDIPQYIKHHCKNAAEASEVAMDLFDAYVSRVPSEMELAIIPKTAGTITTAYFEELYDKLDQMGYRLLCVAHDYIKTIKPKDPSIKEPRFAYEAISEEMKAFAKDFNVCMISAFQLNRKYATRKNELLKNNALKGEVVNNEGNIVNTADPKKNRARMLSVDDIAESAAMAHSADVVVMIEKEEDKFGNPGEGQIRKYLGIKNVKCRDGASEQVGYFQYKPNHLSLYSSWDEDEHQCGRGRYSLIDEYRPIDCLDFATETMFKVDKPKSNSIDKAFSVGNKDKEDISSGGLDEIDNILNEEEASRKNAINQVSSAPLPKLNKKKNSLFANDSNPKPVQSQVVYVNPFAQSVAMREVRKNAVCPFERSRKMREDRSMVAANTQDMMPVYYQQPVYYTPVPVPMYTAPIVEERDLFKDLDVSWEFGK